MEFRGYINFEISNGSMFVPGSPFRIVKKPRGSGLPGTNEGSFDAKPHSFLFTFTVSIPRVK